MIPLYTPSQLLTFVGDTDTLKTVMQIQTERTQSLLYAAVNMPKLERSVYHEISSHLTDHGIEITPAQLEATLKFFPDVIISIAAYSFCDTESRSAVCEALALFYIGTTYHHELAPLINSQIITIWSTGKQPMKPDWRIGHFYEASKGKCDVCDSVFEIGVEPRFGYSVCEQHSVMKPHEIAGAKARKLAAKEACPQCGKIGNSHECHHNYHLQFK